MARITIDGVWRETLAETREHFAAFATLTAAFVFLPALLFGAAMPATPLVRTGAAALPAFPAWFFPALLLVITLQSVAMLTIVAIAGDPARAPNETVGQTLARVLPGVARYLGALVVLFVGYLAISVPVGIIASVLLAGAGAAGAKADPAAASGALVLALLVILPLLLWVGARLSPMPGVFAVERSSPVRGIARAWALSDGAGGRIVVVIVVFTLAVLLLLLVTQGLAAALGGAATLAGTHSLGVLLFVTLSAVANACVSILFTVALGVIYRQLREGAAR